MNSQVIGNIPTERSANCSKSEGDKSIEGEKKLVSHSAVTTFSRTFTEVGRIATWARVLDVALSCIPVRASDGNVKAALVLREYLSGKGNNRVAI